MGWEPTKVGPGGPGLPAPYMRKAEIDARRQMGHMLLLGTASDTERSGDTREKSALADGHSYEHAKFVGNFEAGRAAEMGNDRYEVRFGQQSSDIIVGEKAAIDVAETSRSHRVHSRVYRITGPRGRGRKTLIYHRDDRGILRVNKSSVNLRDIRFEPS